MPIYEQHYRLWEGVPRPRWFRWTVITRYHLRRIFSQKGRNVVFSLLSVAAMIHVVFLLLIYGVSNLEMLEFLNIPRQALPKITPQFFLWPFIPMAFIVGLLTLIVGSGLIADDRRDNSIPLYLSKPLTPAEYILGKFGVIAFFVLLVTAVPINVLFLFEVLMHGGVEFAGKYWWLPLSITAFSLIIMALCGAVILMASSLSKRGNTAGAITLGLFFGHNALVTMLAGTTDEPKLMMLGLQNNVYRIGLRLFGQEKGIQARSIPFDAGEAFIVLVVIVAACLLIVWRRVRPVEVVK